MNLQSKASFAMYLWDLNPQGNHFMCTISLNIKISVSLLLFAGFGRIRILPEILCHKFSIFEWLVYLHWLHLLRWTSFAFWVKLFFCKIWTISINSFGVTFQNYAKNLSNVARSVIANNSTLESWIAFHMFNLSSCLDGYVDTIDQLNVKSDRGRHVTVILVFFQNEDIFI